MAAHPVLATTADRHRPLRTHSAAPFDPIARVDEAPSSSPPLSATIHSLADTRVKRAPPTGPRQPFRWTMARAVAANLIATALDRQLAGEPGSMRVALSFQDRQGDFCCGSSAQHVAGMACRDNGGWQLRYGAPGTARHSDQRSAGGNAEPMRFVKTIIAGEVLDHAGEEVAQAKHLTR